MISHKETWSDLASPSGYSSIGGFPYHVSALSSLFHQTDLIVTLRKRPPPSGTIPLIGRNLAVRPLPEPYGSDLRRKLALLLWLPRYLPAIWRAVRQADVVHTPVPGDVGTIGLLIAFIQRKHLFVRHCGTWGEPVTVADRLLLWLLEHIAGGKNVVLATGGSDRTPSTKNPHIHWIFSSTLTSEELEQLPRAKPWIHDQPLRLITVCRLSAAKNVQAAIRAIPLIQAFIPNVFLDIVGDGVFRRYLEKLTTDLKLTDRVSFYGNVSHKAVLEALAQAHIFVFPTHVKEGFPKAVLEALACGLPVAATNVSTLPHLLKDCGYILQGTTPEDISKAILELTRDTGQLAEMAGIAIDRSRQYSLEKWRDTIRQYLHLAWGGLNENDAPIPRLGF